MYSCHLILPVYTCHPAIYLGPNMVEVMKITVTSFKRSHACAATLSAPNPAAVHDGPTSLLETPGHSQASLGSLLWGHCSFPLGPSAHKFLFVPSKSLFPQSCVHSGSAMVGLMATSSKRAYAIPRSVCCTQSPCPCGRPLLTCSSTADTQTQFTRFV